MAELEDPGFQCDHPEPCACYAKGYVQGKDKVYFEIRAMLNDNTHAARCGCEPCLIIREVREALK